MVPRHSLENDLVVSLNLLKTESGLLKARQLLCRASSPSSSSSSRRPRARPAMSAQDLGSSGQWPGRREGRAGGRSYFMAPGEDDARPAQSALSAPDAWEAALESAPPAPQEQPALQSARSRCNLGAGRAGSLSLATPGAVRAIAQTRVSHHSGPSIASHTGRRATGEGLYCGMNHPCVDALSSPCVHTDITRRDLEAEDTMVTEPCAGRQTPLIALTTSWGSSYQAWIC